MGKCSFHSLSTGYEKIHDKAFKNLLLPRAVYYLHISRYSRLLAHYPYVVIGMVSVVVAVCMLVTFIMGETPDFSDPTLVSCFKFCA